VLKRDAVAKVVLNNLYKHTQLQTTFGANMLALVDDVPRTLPLDAFIRHWVDHQIDVIVRRTAYRLKQAEDQIHLLRGYLKALDQLDAVIALIRASATVEVARDRPHGAAGHRRDPGHRHPQPAAAAPGGPGAAEDHRRARRAAALIADYTDILAKPERQRTIVSEELAEIVEKYGDDRRTRIEFFEGDMSVEDLIPEEDVVVTITRGGYAKRTKTDLYRSQRRGGKGVRGCGSCAARTSSSTSSRRRPTTGCSSSPTSAGSIGPRATSCPRAVATPRVSTSPTCWPSSPARRSPRCLAIKDYEQAPYLVLATRAGLVKKTRLAEYDSPRSGGLIAVNLRDDDVLVGAGFAAPEDDLLLVSRLGQSVRFRADDDQLRPMGRATSGVTGMRFKADDVLLAMSVVQPATEPDVFVVFENGLAKRTPVTEYRVQGRGGTGIQVAKLSDKGGHLVGALTVTRRGRGHGRHGEGQDRALPGRRGPAYRALDDGREVRDARPPVTRLSPLPVTPSRAPRRTMAYRLTRTDRRPPVGRSTHDEYAAHPRHRPASRRVGWCRWERRERCREFGCRWRGWRGWRGGEWRGWRGAGARFRPGASRWRALRSPAPSTPSGGAAGAVGRGASRPVVSDEDVVPAVVRRRSRARRRDDGALDDSVRHERLQ
jgi:DNA gyrase/topoisomerase IV subunit A